MKMKKCLLLISSLFVLLALNSCKKEDDLVSDDLTQSPTAKITGVVECNGSSGGDSVIANVGGNAVIRIVTNTPGGGFTLSVKPNALVSIRISNGAKDTTISVTSGNAGSNTGLGFIRLCGVNNGLFIAAGSNFCLTVKPDGTLWSWGSDASGQTGQGTLTTFTQTIPTRIGTDNNWRSVVCGTETGFALRSDGNFYAFGNNEEGSVGCGSAAGNWVLSPVQVGGFTELIASRGYSLFRILSNGTLWAHGAISCGYPLRTYTPIQVGTETQWTQVSDWGGRAYVLKTDGTLWATSSTQISVGSLTAELTQVGTETWSKIASGVGIKTDGTLWSYQNNNWIQIPNTGTGWVKLSSGVSHYMAVKSDGSLWAWGANTNGQLGLNDTNPRSAPVRVGTENNWLDVSAGGDFTIATKNNGSVWTWGSNSVGQLGTGDGADHLTPFQIYF